MPRLGRYTPEQDHIDRIEKLITQGAFSKADLGLRDAPASYILKIYKEKGRIAYDTAAKLWRAIQ